MANASDYKDGSNKTSSDVGDIKLTARATAPTGWLICDGSAISRTDYSGLFTAISTSYGIGDGVTTFNIPNFRGRVGVGVGQLIFNTSFSYTDVNITTDVITILANDTLYTGTPVTITTSGTIPTGLALATTYYVIKLTATTIKLATTLSNALAGTGINITAQGTGTHTLTYIGTNRNLGNVGGEESHSLIKDENAPHNHTFTDGGSNVLTVSTGGFTTTDSADNNNPVGNTTSVSGSGLAHNNMQPYTVVNYVIKY